MKEKLNCRHKWVPLLGRAGRKNVPTALFTCLKCGEMKVGRQTIRISNSRLDMGGHPIYAGNIILSESYGIVLTAALSADGKYSGIVEAGTAGTTLAFGDLCYLAVADSRWELAKADAAATSGGVKLGMCVLAAAGDGSATTMLTYGKIRADAKFPTFTVGALIYISAATAGAIVAGATNATTGQPTGANNVIRVVGWGNTADEMMFSPSQDYITHT